VIGRGGDICMLLLLTMPRYVFLLLESKSTSHVVKKLLMIRTAERPTS